MGRDFSLPEGFVGKVRAQEDKGFVLIEVKENLGHSREREVHAIQVARDFARGNRESVVVKAVNAIRLGTRERVLLTFYFVDRRQYRPVR